jgi:hypothetical protein
MNVDIDLRVYEYNTIDDVTTFDYAKTLNLSHTYEILSIEFLESDYGVFPYESSFLDEKDYNQYIGALQDYFDRISEDVISDSNIRLNILKPKLEVTLTYDNTLINIKFYQDSTGEIVSSHLEYVDDNGNDLYHIFNENSSIEYSEFNEH